MSTQLSEAMQRLRRAAATRSDGPLDVGAGALELGDLETLRELIREEVAREGIAVDEAQLQDLIDRSIADQLPAMINAAVRAEFSLREQRTVMQETSSAKAPVRRDAAERRLLWWALIVAGAVLAVVIEPARAWLFQPEAGGVAAAVVDFWQAFTSR